MVGQEAVTWITVPVAGTLFRGHQFADAFCVALHPVSRWWTSLRNWTTTSFHFYSPILEH